MTGPIRRGMIISAATLLTGGIATAAVAAASASPAAQFAASNAYLPTTAQQSRAPAAAQWKQPTKIGMAVLVRLTAKTVGQSSTQVREELRSGKTLNDVAGGQAGAVRSAALQRVQKALDRAVAKGKITSAQEATLLSKAGNRIDKLMSTLPTKHSAPPSARTS